MKWKVNQLSSRLVKIVPHTVYESILIQLLIGGIVGWFTFESFMGGTQNWITYLGLGITLILLIVSLFDIYILISDYRLKKRDEQADESP